ncbi:MAG: L-seryl-tRNA(Sec) selenium transferase [Aggregatilineales bacterium]
MNTPHEKLRQLPAIDKVLQTTTAQTLITQYTRTTVLDALRDMLSEIRERLLSGEDVPIAESTILRQLTDRLEMLFCPTLRPVINATGVIIHTNLGRALLSKSAQDAIVVIAGQYNTLEFDLETGKRGSRYLHAERLLCDLTGAEAALVVNNNASALVLLLSALARGRSVILSRGHLVEIGGGFRVPTIMEQGGATLVEVGTTNRTRITDYAAAIDETTALLMRVHSSNFRQIGFVEETPLSEMAALAHEHQLTLVDDIGSGALLNTADYGLLPEPLVQESIADGADIVAFSGDKLLGGPQCGILVGKKSLIQTLKKHPLARAVRADKLCYAALGATLMHYRRDEALTHIPVWQMISRSQDDIQQTAQRWATTLNAEIIPGESTVGGGSLPGVTLPTTLLVLSPSAPDAFMAQLRRAPVPIIARISDNQVLFDPRTVLSHQEDMLLKTLTAQQSNTL